MKNNSMILSVLCLLAFTLTCRGKESSKEVLDKFISAYNAHDSLAVKAVIADTARYFNTQSARKASRPLLAQLIVAWNYPVTAHLVMTEGTLEGKAVTVLWGQPELADGQISPWTKLLLMEPEISGGRVVRVAGTMMIDKDRTLADRIQASAPQ